MDSPLIIHIPHSSEYVPTECRGEIQLTEDELKREIAQMTDKYTDELFLPERTASLRFPVSRLVCDPERFRLDADESMSAVGMGAAYERTSEGKKFRELTSERREGILREYYDVHHAFLSAMVAERLSAFGRCVVMDCHSFPSVPLSYETDRSQPRPDFCIGTDAYHTPDELRELCVGLLRGEGFTVKLNSPFGGALVPAQYYCRDKRVASVMLEVNRSIYMTENGEKTPNFELVRSATLGLASAVRVWSKMSSAG
jgi:N-formylglutamate deformylase